MNASLRTVVKHVVYALVMYLMITLQCVLFDRIEIFGARPQTVFLFVLALSFFEGARTGAVYGLIGGYLVDVVSGGGIYFSAVVCVIICYVAAYAVEFYFTDGYLPYLAAAALFVVAKHVVDTFVILANYKSFNFFSVIFKIYLPELAYTLLVSAAVYFPMMLLCSRMNKEG